MTRIHEKISPEVRAKMRAAKLGKTHSLEHNAKIGEGLKRWWATKKKVIVPAHLRIYAKKLRSNGIKGAAFRKAIEDYDR